MLIITTQPVEGIDDNNIVISIKPATLQLEHSLISIAKWESIYERSFFESFENEKVQATHEEIFEYFKCMIIGKLPENFCEACLTESNIIDIKAYMTAKKTATTIKTIKKKTKIKKDFISSEIIYFWMFSQGIPIECEKWHLNRLMTLINIFAEKNNPEKMSKAELAARHRKLNSSRRKKR